MSVSIVLSFLLLSSVLTILLNNKFSLKEATSLYFRKTGETVSYWFANKFMKDPLFSLASVFGSGDFGFRKNNYPEGEELANSIPVLIYHGIPDEGHGDNPFSSPHFTEQMNALKENGWGTISLDQFYRFMQGDLSLPEKSFLLTFDDGRKDTYYPVDPVLKDLGFHAVMFAITKESLSQDNIQSSYYLSEFELKDMEKSGRWDIQSHGRDSHDWYTISKDGKIGHFFSNLFWLAPEGRLENEDEFRKRIIYDLSNSKKDLERSLEKNIIAFAFPFSDFGETSLNFQKSRDILQSEVPKYYKLAFYQAWPGDPETFSYPNKDQFMIKRIEPLSNWGGADLLQAIETGVSKKLPYSSNDFGKEWVLNWGAMKVGENINIKASDKTTGASVVLGGSWIWKNYIFNADISWKSGSNIVLIARFDDEGDYYGCNFSKEKVSIKRASHGSSYNILNQTYRIPSLSSPLNLGIKVDGETVSCLVDDQIVLEGVVNYRIQNGGIGIEIWDEREGVANAYVDNIRVVPI